jgi:hypothetical protein
MPRAPGQRASWQAPQVHGTVMYGTQGGQNGVNVRGFFVGIQKTTRNKKKNTGKRHNPGTDQENAPPAEPGRTTPNSPAPVPVLSYSRCRPRSSGTGAIKGRALGWIPDEEAIDFNFGDKWLNENATAVKMASRILAASRNARKGGNKGPSARTRAFLEKKKNKPARTRKPSVARTQAESTGPTSAAIADRTSHTGVAGGQPRE